MANQVFFVQSNEEGAPDFASIIEKKDIKKIRRDYVITYIKKVTLSCPPKTFLFGYKFTSLRRPIIQKRYELDIDDDFCKQLLDIAKIY